MRARRSVVLIAGLAMAAVSPGHADPIAGAVVFEGSAQRVEMHFGDDLHLFIDAGGVGGPLVEVVEEPPYAFTGTTGKGGKDLILAGSGENMCILDGDDDWLLTVEPDAGSAHLISAVPGCAGSIDFVGVGGPGFAVTPTVWTEPDARGAGVGFGLTTSRWATASGSLAGVTIDEVNWARISYTQQFETGGGLASP